MLFVLISASISFAFETGTWKGRNGDIKGEIKITRSGSDYLAKVDIYQPSRPNFDEGYCLEQAKAKEVNGSLQIYHEGKVGFTLLKDGKDLKVIQGRGAGLPECGDPPSWAVDDITRMKWKKVK